MEVTAKTWKRCFRLPLTSDRSQRFTSTFALNRPQKPPPVKESIRSGAIAPPLSGPAWGRSAAGRSSTSAQAVVVAARPIDGADAPSFKARTQAVHLDAQGPECGRGRVVVLDSAQAFAERDRVELAVDLQLAIQGRVVHEALPCDGCAFTKRKRFAPIRLELVQQIEQPRPKAVAILSWAVCPIRYTFRPTEERIIFGSWVRASVMLTSNKGPRALNRRSESLAL